MKPIITLALLLGSFLYADQVYTTFDVEAEKTSELTLTSTGIIRSIHADIGDRVRKGALLLELDNDDLKRSVELAEADLERARVSHRFAKRTYERYQKVKDVIDEDQYEQYVLSYEGAVAELNSAKANLAYKKALLEKSILRAPYDGIIAQRYKELGDGLGAGMVEPVFNLISARGVKLILTYDEKYWRKVKVGDKVTYRVDGSDETFTGTVAKVHPTVDPKTRKASAELYSKDLLPGLFGEGTIEVE